MGFQAQSSKRVSFTMKAEIHGNMTRDLWTAQNKPVLLATMPRKCNGRTQGYNELTRRCGSLMVGLIHGLKKIEIIHTTFLPYSRIVCGGGCCCFFGYSVGFLSKSQPV